MVNRKIIITRETDNVVISININSNYKYFKRSWKIYGDNILPSTTPVYYDDVDNARIDVRSHRITYNIISPFNLEIRLKPSFEKLKAYLLNNYVLDDNTVFSKMLQKEIDGVFSSDAKKAALIIDQRGYEETPERYMLGPLVIHDELCERYGVTPMLRLCHPLGKIPQMPSYTSHDKTTRTIPAFLVTNPHQDVYCKFYNGSYYVWGQRFEGAARRNNMIFKAVNNMEIEDLARWGLIGKRKSCVQPCYP